MNGEEVDVLTWQNSGMTAFEIAIVRNVAAQFPDGAYAEFVRLMDRDSKAEADKHTNTERTDAVDNPSDFRPSPGHEWSRYAVCSMSLVNMFPSDGDAKGIELAKENCQVCPVRAECLREAYENGEQWGVWGGLTTEERRQQRARMVRRTGGRVPLDDLVDEVLVLSDAEALDVAADSLIPSQPVPSDLARVA